MLIRKNRKLKINSASKAGNTFAISCLEVVNEAWREMREKGFHTFETFILCTTKLSVFMVFSRHSWMFVRSWPNIYECFRTKVAAKKIVFFLEQKLSSRDYKRKKSRWQWEAEGDVDGSCAGRRKKIFLVLSLHWNHANEAKLLCRSTKFNIFTELPNFPLNRLQQNDTKRNSSF